MAEATRLCGDAATAEDLVMRTFFKAIKNIDQHKADESLIAWMKAILRNLYLNDQRKPVARGTTPVDPEVMAADESLATNESEEQILRDSDHDALREAVERLPPIYRDSVVLHYFEEFSIKDIAIALNAPQGTIFRRLNVARKLLAKDLAVKLGKKKPLAILVAAILGVGALFGAWQAVEAIFDSPSPSTSASSSTLPTTLTTTKEKSKMNTLKRITLATTAAASVMSMSAPAEVPEPTPTDYGWTRTYTQDGREFVVTAYTKPGSGYEFKVPDGISAIDYLVVGGGGSGGTSFSAGGGGAGGYLEENGVAVTGGSVLSITVGAGGASSGTGNGNNGGNSSIEGMAEALGGGAGGGTSSSGTSGGSGGGGSGWALTWGSGYGVLPLPTIAGSAGTAGQGYAGGAGCSTGENASKDWLTEYGGGGGGAGGVGGAEGSPADFAKYMVGGAGKVSSITGEEAEYARGGNGSSYNFTYGTTPSIPAPIGPGNGSSAGSGSQSAAGCDGIVIIRYELKKNVSIKVTPNAGYQVSLDNETFVDSIDDELPSGDSVTVYAKGASEEVAFAWTGLPNGAVVSTDTKSATFTMPGEAVDISVVGTVTTMYTLTVGSTECGVVTGTANGKYILGYPVALTATANENCVFVGWTVNGADEGNDPTLAFELTADTTVLATFREKAKYTLTVVGSDYGTITGGEAVEYFEGDKVTLTATPNEGLVFVGWGDDAASFGNAPSIELTMDANKTVSAKFGYTLTITGSPYGTIASNPSGDAFAVGEQVTLTATPNEGCEFLEWAGDATGVEPTTMVTIDAAKTVSAAFKDAGGKAHYTWGWTSEVKNEKGRVTGYVTAFTQVGNHTFTVPNGIKEIDYLVVGGGGSGGAEDTGVMAGGGGGAGGFIEASGVSVKSGTKFTITVGAGGAANGNNGASSLLAGLADEPIEALGGGAGGKCGFAGSEGASGGGAGGYNGYGDGWGVLPLKTRAGGAGKQGYDGGAGYSSGSTRDQGKDDLYAYGGGGGGAGGAGGNGWTENDFPNNTDYIMQGGPGKVSAITGEEVEYAKGGNGNLFWYKEGTPTATTPVGPGNGSSIGAAGCDGIVIIRYAPRKPGIMIMLY